MPTILVPQTVLEGSGICGEVSAAATVEQSQGQLAASSALTELQRPATAIVSLVLFALGLIMGA